MCCVKKKVAKLILMCVHIYMVKENDPSCVKTCVRTCTYIYIENSWRIDKKC